MSQYYFISVLGTSVMKCSIDISSIFKFLHYLLMFRCSGSHDTVTRDLRNTEFKAILKAQQEANTLMKELIKLKKAKYMKQGFL